MESGRSAQESGRSVYGDRALSRMYNGALHICQNTRKGGNDHGGSKGMRAPRESQLGQWKTKEGVRTSAPGATWSSWCSLRPLLTRPFILSSTTNVL